MVFMVKVVDNNGFNNFDDFIKILNEYINSFNSETNNKNSDNGAYGNSANNNSSNEDCNDCKFGNKNAQADEKARNACSDIPGGFQDLNPIILNLITVIFGSIASQKMPFNVQNAIGNWLQLFGQVIITFNAQQQYYQGGPGRIYSPIYRNAANPFCYNSTDEGQANVATSTSKNTSSNRSINLDENTSSNRNNKSNNTSLEIKKLNDDILSSRSSFNLSPYVTNKASIALSRSFVFSQYTFSFSVSPSPLSTASNITITSSISSLFIASGCGFGSFIGLKPSVMLIGSCSFL